MVPREVVSLRHDRLIVVRQSISRPIRRQGRNCAGCCMRGTAEVDGEAMPLSLPVRRAPLLGSPPASAPCPTGEVELVVDGNHFARIVRDGILKAQTSLDIATADFKAMLVPEPGTRR